MYYAHIDVDESPGCVAVAIHSEVVIIPMPLADFVVCASAGTI